LLPPISGGREWCGLLVNGRKRKKKKRTFADRGLTGGRMVERNTLAAKKRKTSAVLYLLLIIVCYLFIVIEVELDLRLTQRAPISKRSTDPNMQYLCLINFIVLL
jgi:hypothetical protein